MGNGVNKDTVWIGLIAYARAAGAPSVGVATAWARDAVGMGKAPFDTLCERIDLAASYWIGSPMEARWVEESVNGDEDGR